MGKTLALLAIAAILTSAPVGATATEEVTICFSRMSCGTVTTANDGDRDLLCDGQCQGRTLEEMYADGWKLVEVMDNIDVDMGFVFEKQ